MERKIKSLVEKFVESPDTASNEKYSVNMQTLCINFQTFEVN